MTNLGLGPPDDSERGTIVVDAYRIKAPAGDLGEPRPASWTEVKDQVIRHLIRIAAAPTRLAAELLEGATRLVRGLTSLPSSISVRLRQAHDRADTEEHLRQSASPTALRRQTSVTDVEPASVGSDAEGARAVQRVAEILEKMRNRGLDAYVVIQTDGKVVVVLGAPKGSEAVVKEVLEHVDDPAEEPRIVS